MSAARETPGASPAPPARVAASRAGDELLPDTPFESAAPEGAGTRFRCGLCGTAFTHGGRVCGACPLNAGCDLVRCPSCGYQFPRSSRIVEWGRRAWRALRGRRA